MRRSLGILWALTTLLVIGSMTACGGTRLTIGFAPASDDLVETTVIGKQRWRSDKIALIDVTGLIVDARRGGLITRGENPVGRFTEALQKAADDTRVRAIVVRVNSPGGTVTASDVMYRELDHFRKSTQKPVVILMADVAASGGYYLACAGDYIIAHPTTVTGSIGVIMQTIDVSGGLQRIGVHTEAITSGPNKDLASPLRPMSEEHRAILQGIVSEFYRSFRQIVVDARPALSASDLDRATDGRVVTGEHAATIGLVDAVGDLRTAFAEAKKRANSPDALLVKYHRPMEHVSSAYAQDSVPMPTAAGAAATQQINLLQFNIEAGSLFDQPGFYYLWDPSVW